MRLNAFVQAQTEPSCGSNKEQLQKGLGDFAMSLYDVDIDKEIDSVSKLWHQKRHQHEFETVWYTMSQAERGAIEREVNRRLDELIAHPDASWGSITNASIEGGKASPDTGIRGDWSGTVFQPIYEACGLNEERAGMFFGIVWKRIIVERREHWIGLHADPTFPQRGVTLEGKTYFLDQSSRK